MIYDFHAMEDGEYVYSYLLANHTLPENASNHEILGNSTVNPQSIEYQSRAPDDAVAPVKHSLQALLLWNNG